MFFRYEDPVKDAQAYQDELENEPHLNCDLCGEPIYVGDTAWRISDEWLCEDCAKQEYMRNVTHDDVE